jgi:hypothetical protein
MNGSFMAVPIGWIVKVPPTNSTRVFLPSYLESSQPWVWFDVLGHHYGQLRHMTSIGMLEVKLVDLNLMAVAV